MQHLSANSAVLTDLVPLLSDLGLALLFALGWWKWQLLGADGIKSLLLLLLAEMLLLAAGFALIRTAAESGLGWWLMWALFLGYGWMAYGLSRLFSNWWPMIGMGVLLLARGGSDLLPAAFGLPGVDPQLLATRAVILMSAVFLTALVPLPGLSINATAARQLNLPGSGLWVDRPERLLAAGLVYFLSVAAARLILS